MIYDMIIACVQLFISDGNKAFTLQCSAQ